MCVVVQVLSYTISVHLSCCKIYLSLFRLIITNQSIISSSKACFRRNSPQVRPVWNYYLCTQCIGILKNKVDSWFREAFELSHLSHFWLYIYIFQLFRLADLKIVVVVMVSSSCKDKFSASKKSKVDKLVLSVLKMVILLSKEPWMAPVDLSYPLIKEWKCWN